MGMTGQDFSGLNHDEYNTNLSLAGLYNSSLKGANLSLAGLYCSSLEGANLSLAGLYCSNFQKSIDICEMDLRKEIEE